MPSIRKLGKNTLYDNERMTRFNAPNLRKLGDNVLFSNTILDSEDDKVYVPKLTRVGRVVPKYFTHCAIKICHDKIKNPHSHGDFFMI